MARLTNQEVANVLYEIADILEIQGVQFKPRAYRRAAQSIETLAEGIDKVPDLETIPGVGKNIASKIRELLETGELAYLEEIRAQIPPGLADLIKIEGLGPKKALKLYKELKIRDIGDLEKAAKEGRLRRVEGFGPKTEKNLLEAIGVYRGAHERFILGYILPTAEGIEKKMAELVKKVSLAGSVRRRKETVHDVDIIAASDKPSKVMDFFVSLPEVKRVAARGETKSTVVLANNLHMDLRVVGEKSYGSALNYLTGSKEHNIRLRQIAIDRNMKLSEYGLFDRKTNRPVAGRDEEGIYKALGMDYVEPELREDRGEIEAAQSGKLPRLIKYDEIKGDIHTHSTWSEGTNSIEEMALAARAMGWEYIAMCDHSRTLRVAHGLTDAGFRKQMKEIEALNRKMDGFTVLSGVEANIDSDGKIDVSKNILKDLDIVLASVHSGFKQPEKRITQRILNAMHNDYVDAICHPTGRLIDRRQPYAIGLETVFEEASKLNVLMEINAFPDRTDLSDANCLKAKRYGIRFSIGTDAHNRDHLRYMRLGVATARRAWLEKKDVANTLGVKDLLKSLR